MSHIAKYTTDLVGIDTDLCRKAMEVLAKKFGGEVSTTVDASHEGLNMSSWKGRKIVAAVRTRNLPSGLGVIREADGKPSLVADPYGRAREVDLLKAEFLKTYRTLAIAVAMKGLGYDVLASASGGTTVIKGEKK